MQHQSARPNVLCKMYYITRQENKVCNRVNIKLYRCCKYKDLKTDSVLLQMS